MITAENLRFLEELEKNNDRDWFNDHKVRYKKNQENVKIFFKEIYEALREIDKVDDYKIFRIYRDIRFSKNKLPYKNHYSASYHRQKPELRGGYYVHLQPKNKSFIATGFWNPEKDDLFRIRKEFEFDVNELETIINTTAFKAVWGDLQGEELKSAPRDFDKNHPNISYIKKKQFVFRRNFTDVQVLSSDFKLNILKSFKAIRPYFDYMSNVLTTDLNGSSIL